MSQNPIITYIYEHWPIVVFFIGGIWGIIVWLKQQFIDNVYATKQELRKTTDEIESKLANHEKADLARYDEIRKTMSENHDEVKNLIIRVLEK